MDGLSPHSTAKAPALGTSLPLGGLEWESPAHLLNEKVREGNMSHHTW